MMWRWMLGSWMLIAGGWGLGWSSLAAQQWTPAASAQTAAEQAIDEAPLRAHIQFLADDLLEGRGPGSRGDLLAQRYLIAQLSAWGFQPGSAAGGWLQSVPLVGVKTNPIPSISVRGPAGALSLMHHDDYILVSGKPQPEVEIENAEIVFVGYGIQAPEYQWDDFKDVDLRGKILLMLNNDPAGDPELFAGNRRLYYGRWDYKYESAARQGAAGAIIIHTTASAGYPYQVVQTSWSGEEFELRGRQGPRLDIKGWLTEDAARRLAEFSGHDLDQMRALAENREFRPQSLGVHLSLKLTSVVRQQDTANVLGVLPGSDPQLAQDAVVIMAHHDHIGMAEQRDEQGDQIYNGAVDNASGVAAMLTIAQAFARLQHRPARSIMIAAVGAEEQGLLGSAYLAQHPPRLAGRLAAVVNIDGLNFLGPTHDVNNVGLGKSSVDQIVENVAAWQHRVVTPDQFPDRGYYYRSDQFSMAKIGVPGIYLHPGINVVGKPDGWGKQQLEEWIEKTYHQPGDEYRTDWDLRGAVQDTRLLFFCALHIANQPELPTWNPGDEFEAARWAALKAVQEQ